MDNLMEYPSSIPWVREVLNYKSANFLSRKKMCLVEAQWSISLSPGRLKQWHAHDISKRVFAYPGVNPTAAIA